MPDTLREKIAALISEHESRCENPWNLQSPEQCADRILAMLRERSIRGFVDVGVEDKPMNLGHSISTNTKGD